ncbi:MAG TPA: hypothetical protein VMO47_07715, partial [Rhodothermales bacterium]|nr:hypothetical protein [Rhodothermales bacterium]
MYTDAFALDETSIGLRIFPGWSSTRFVHNPLVLSGTRAGELRPERAEWAGLHYTLAVIPLALGIGLRKRDALLTATGMTT